MLSCGGTSWTTVRRDIRTMRSNGQKMRTSPGPLGRFPSRPSQNVTARSYSFKTLIHLNRKMIPMKIAIRQPVLENTSGISPSVPLEPVFHPPGLPIYWNSMPQSGVQLKLDRSGGVTVFCGSIDIGQGSDSVLAYVVAEVLGIDPFDIRVVTGDTDLTPVDLGSYSSRVTLMTGNAALQAAERARELLVEAASAKLAISKARVALADGR